MTNFANYLQENSSKADRWQLLYRFVQDWRLQPVKTNPYFHEDIVKAERSLGHSLPAALREWHVRSFPPYKLQRYVRTYNYLIPPSELKPDGEYLPILTEQQGCDQWGLSTLDLEKDDPSVYYRNLPYLEYVGDTVRRVEAGNWELENERLTEFVVQMLLFETFSVTGFSAQGDGELSVLERIEATFSRMGFPDWHYPAERMVFYGAEDAILSVIIQKDIDIMFAALSLPTLEKAMAALGDININWRWIKTEGEAEK